MYNCCCCPSGTEVIERARVTSSRRDADRQWFTETVYYVCPECGATIRQTIETEIPAAMDARTLIDA